MKGYGLDELPAWPEGLPTQLNDGLSTEVESGHDEEGDKLGHGGGEGSTLNLHAQAPVKHEDGVQKNVQGRAGDDGDGGNLHRGLRPGGAVHALGGEVCQGGNEHPEGIVLGLANG